ncbi:polysaccharide lyase 8 family protein [Mangrovibacterium diazotrophicum]|uniref:Chondroitin AC lyase n=1 Tax=Mangrovibacterium diazotrophicum TaxID=1261403 RepID=A0A419VZ00_9BACT|nr:polysaccharide lyase 8 family protein [Mangrovibacterium diazotrophicum]RKD88290.1 chondroitin AC lyase [Mangrovibacterium diazotrophicum]
MIKLIRFFLCASISITSLLSCAQSTAEYPDHLYKLHQNIWNELLVQEISANTLSAWLDEMDESGTWSDIDYSSLQRGEWPVADHLRRLQALAIAWQQPASKFYQEDEVRSNILLALDYWLEHDFICPNWWYPQIGVPQLLGPTVLLMEKELTAAQLDKAIEILSRAEIKLTGQNKVWLSGNVLLRALLQRDAETVAKAARAIQEELKVGDGEGIQPDWSFHQHGPQQQFGNYGSAYAVGMVYWMGILDGTPFHFTEDKVAILRNYLLEGIQWVIWKGQIDVSALGRQFFVDYQKKRANEIMGCLEKFAKITGKAWSDEEIPMGIRYFRNSDYLLKREEDYFFSLKMCSDRVAGAESCNSENISGYYMGDGATFLSQSPDEYLNIFPFWDWQKIPGVTAVQDTASLPILTYQGYFLESDFVGGVSNGKRAVAAMDYKRDQVFAKKSWFVLEDQMVCLGAGIQSDREFEMTTGIEQTYLSGEVVVKNQNANMTVKDSVHLENPVWVLHKGAGYFFPQGGSIVLKAGEVHGNWHKVAWQYPSSVMDTSLLCMYFEHGVKPEQASYAYALVPGADVQKLTQMETAPSFRILQNTADAQVVQAADDSWFGAAVYSSENLKLPFGLHVDQACLIMANSNGKQLELSLADPTQKLKGITISCGRSYTCEENEFVRQISPGGFYLDFPQNDRLGDTRTFTLHKN